MRRVDRMLQNWRIAKALPYVKDGDRLLDIGCYDRVLLNRVAARATLAVGVDPLAEPYTNGKVRVIRTTVPGSHRFESDAFDCITMLAVLEHIREREALSRECFRLLAPGGRVIITVPHPAVDQILHVLLALRLIDGMSLEEHHQYDAHQTSRIFQEAGFQLLRRRRFQLGLNFLFVFVKP